MMTQVARVLAALLVLAALSLPGGPARAQEGRGAPPKVIELEALTIEGKVAKPQVFYVLRRSRVSYENLKMHRVFVDRIIDSALKSTF